MWSRAWLQQAPDAIRGEVRHGRHGGRGGAGAAAERRADRGLRLGGAGGPEVRRGREVHTRQLDALLPPPGRLKLRYLFFWFVL